MGRPFVAEGSSHCRTPSSRGAVEDQASPGRRDGAEGQTGRLGIQPQRMRYWHDAANGRRDSHDRWPNREIVTVRESSARASSASTAGLHHSHASQIHIASSSSKRRTTSTLTYLPHVLHQSRLFTQCPINRRKRLLGSGRRMRLSTTCEIMLDV